MRLRDIARAGVFCAIPGLAHAQSAPPVFPIPRTPAVEQRSQVPVLLPPPDWQGLEGKPISRVGVVLEGNTGPRVSDVADASPAGEAGLAAGDEFLAVEGRPFRLGILRYCLERRREVPLTVRRGERIFSALVPVGRRSEVSRLSWAGSEAEGELVRSWLGAPDFRPAPGESIGLEAYDNFHGIQTVL